MKRTILALTAALVLAIPGSAFATSSTGATTESLSVATVSMTVPASVTYTPAGGDYSGSINLSGITSDNASGITIKVKPSVLSNGGSGTIATTDRKMTTSGATAPLTSVALIDYGGFPNATTAVTIASANATFAGNLRTLNVVSFIRGSAVVVGGSYTGTLEFTATTNP